MKEKVIIEIEDGIVTNVVSSIGVDVVVIDRDNQDNGYEFIEFPDVVQYPYDDLYLFFGTDCTRDQEVMEVLKHIKI